MDLVLVDYYAPKIAAARQALWSPAQLAAAVGKAAAVMPPVGVRKAVTTSAQLREGNSADQLALQDAIDIVTDELGFAPSDAELMQVLKSAWADAYLAGHLAADRDLGGQMLAAETSGGTTTVPEFLNWDVWKPGNPLAARFATRAGLAKVTGELDAQTIADAAEDFSDELSDEIDETEEALAEAAEAEPEEAEAEGEAEAQVEQQGAEQGGEHAERPEREREGEGEGEGARADEARAADVGADAGEAAAQIDRAATQAAQSMTATAAQQVSKAVADGLAQGRSVDQIAKTINGVLGDPHAAELIAHTETARYTTAASLARYVAMGVTQWDLVVSAGACPVCLDIAAGNPHRIGDGKQPPEHPFCRCAVSPVVPAVVPGATPPAAGDFPEISRGQLSNPDTPRTRPVTAAEFQQLAKAGQQQYQQLIDAAASPTALTGTSWAQLKDTAWKQSRAAWGGITANSHTGQLVAGDQAPGYALTVKAPGMQTVSVPASAGRAEFDQAMELAKGRFSQILARGDHYLGVFHDADKGTVDFDPVLIVPDQQQVETIGAYTHAVGGAYRFADGLGYWPPYVGETSETVTKAATTTEGAPMPADGEPRAPRGPHMPDSGATVPPVKPSEG